MRKSGRRITASLLAALMIATSVFSNVSVVNATEAEFVNEIQAVSETESLQTETSEEASTSEEAESEASTSEASTSEGEVTETSETTTEETTTEETTSEVHTEAISSNSEEENKIVSIAEARVASEGEELTVKGVVTFVDGKNIYLQDETAGIDAYYKTKPSDISIGDVLIVKGKYKVFNGLVELELAETVELSHIDSELPLKEVTIKELLDDCASEGKLESTRVLVKNVIVGAINNGGNTSLTDEAGNSINAYKIPVLAEEITEGAVVDVTAVVGDYKGIQLRVAKAEDVVLVKAAPSEEEPTQPAEPTVYDPITDEEIASVEGAVSVKDAAALSSGTATVVGQVVYKYVSNATDTSFKNIILEDVIDGTVYGYLIYDYNNSDKYEVGNVVAVTGTATVYSNVPEIKDVTNVTVLKNVDPIEAQEVTLSQLGADYLSEYVLIKDVTLGAYNAGGATNITDATGTSTIFKGVAYPEGVTEGSVVDLYACCTAYKTTYQLKTATADDYYSKAVAEKVEIDESITLPVASFAGTGSLKDKMVVNADLYTENDMLDSNTTFSAYKSGQQVLPYIENKTTDKETQITTYTYSLGSNKGMVQDDYFLIKTDASYYGNMEIAFRTRGSKTAAKNFVVEYSIDGESYKAAGDAHIVANYYNYSTQEDVKVDKVVQNGEYYIVTDGKYQDVSVKLPKEANGAKELFIRVRVRDNSRIDGKESAISSGATTYINGISIKGNPVKSNSICQYVTVSPESGETSVGQELTFKTGTKDAKIYYSFDGEEFKLYDNNSKPVIEKLPCTVSVYAAKDGLKDSVKVLYKYTQVQVATVKATPNGGAVALNSKVKLTCETEGAQIYYAFVKENEEVTEESWKLYSEAITLKELPCQIAVKATKEGYIDSAVKTLPFTERSNEKYNIYFGQMHSHTNYSDGAGSAVEAFEHGKATPNLDFLFITDHSNSYDNCDNANINDGSMSTEWVDGHALAKEYTTDDFVAAMGYEMTWSNGLGHMNTFNSDGFQSRTQADYKTYGTALNNYYNALQKAPDTISQFNHPGTTFGDFQDFAYFSAANDALISLVEVGNGEGEVGSSGYFPSYEYYQRALDKGWHVAPTNNQDNHKGKWGSANTARSVVLADSLTEENIYDAMRNYRVYATEDNDLSIYYTLNDYIMGSILDKDLVGDKVNIKVDLKDPTDSKIGTVQVIANGGIVVDSQKVETNEATVEFEVDNKYSFYYIKIVEADKDIAVTAPVWVGEVEAVGINSVSTTTVLPIKDEAVDVTLDLYNNEKTELELKSVEFSVDGKTIKTVDLAAEKLTTVPSEGTASYTFSYTYNKVGEMTIDVEVKALLNGVEKVYNDKLTLTYVSDDLVSHVVIDGSHYNDYVTGYYGGNMGNFITMAAEKNVKAEIVKTAFTKDTLKNADMLIVSAPGKKTGTANAGDYTPSHYEPEFLEIVKDYVANGGTVIVCGLADYQDSTDAQTATETNKLLEAIGSTIRMNSDEAYDEVNNGGQPYRLYYENYDKSSKWMSGVVEGQTYSAYSGCTVDITNAKENEFVNEAVALVKGFDTTYSIDCKTDAGEKSDSSVYIEKGKVTALAYQDTKFGGAIFVGGTVFMSDFEVKAELDNNDSLPYINYTLMNNILDSKKVVMKATDIATVRKGNLGDVFAIEGYVANGTANEFTKFFDTIYVEDATGGITVFPFAQEGVKNGTKIRIIGYVDQYQGDKELQITSYEILDDVNLKPITATKRTTKEATDYASFGGSLTQVTGKVTRVLVENGVVSEFWVVDESGVEAAVFIDGYIYSGTTGKNEIAQFVKVGATVTAEGFLYLHPEGASEVSVPVLRVADCDTIKLVSEPGTQEPGTENPGAQTPATESTDSNASSSNEKPVQPSVTAPVVVIEEPETALAAGLEKYGQPYADVTQSMDKKVLRASILQKYSGKIGIIMSGISKNVGITIDAAVISAGINTDLNLDIAQVEIPGFAAGFKSIMLDAKTPATLSFQAGIHANVGVENAGKAAYIFRKDLASGQYVLATVMFVNGAGNVATFTNEITDFMILIAE